MRLLIRILLVGSIVTRVVLAGVDYYPGFPVAKFTADDLQQVVTAQKNLIITYDGKKIESDTVHIIEWWRCGEDNILMLLLVKPDNTTMVLPAQYVYLPDPYMQVGDFFSHIQMGLQSQEA